jgi:hypothetical protein
LPALLSLVELEARGDPLSPLRWPCKSPRPLATDVTVRGHPVSRTVVSRLLARKKFSLQRDPEAVRVHDCLLPELGRAVPY